MRGRSREKGLIHFVCGCFGMSEGSKYATLFRRYGGKMGHFAALYMCYPRAPSRRQMLIFPGRCCAIHVSTAENSWRTSSTFHETPQR